MDADGHQTPVKTAKVAGNRLRRRVIGVTILFVLPAAGYLILPHWIARAVVSAPNRNESVSEMGRTLDRELERLGVERELRIEVGPPPASLAVWLMTPPTSTSTASADVRAATVLVLHGMGDSKRSMLPVGRMLTANGCQAVLVDLRGQGSSTGDWLTYGVQESADLVQLIDRLTRDAVITGPIGVYGASYGAATAIQLAGRDPRVRAVVAVAPFARMTDVVPVSVRHYLPGGRFLPVSLLSEAIVIAGALAGFAPDEAAPVQAAAHGSAPLLLIHGRRDAKIPFSQSELIARAAGERVRLIILDDEDHDSIMQDRSGVIAREATAWFGEHLKALSGEDSVAGASLKE